ncbi:MAG: helix-turn-helix domain-containing protein [Coraliomargarita sp.]
MNLGTQNLDTSSIGSILALFDELDDVLFWVKDASHRITALNKAFAERVKLPVSAILGKTDSELYYEELAQVFMEDDQRVLESGEPIRYKVELLTSLYGGVEWRNTTKLPVVDLHGRVIGTAGISRPLPNSAEALPGPYRAFGEIVEYARCNISNSVTVKEIAEQAGMSIATLERRFREHLRLSPRAFLAQMRLSQACQLLRDTPLNMQEIALECGYESPAAFSRAFRREMERSPSEFRQYVRG